MRALISLFKLHGSVIAFGFVLMFFTSPGQTYFIALFSGEIRQDLNLSHGEFGAVYSLATLFSAFVLLKTGSLLDRSTPRSISLSLVFLIATASLIMSQSMNITMLLIAVFLLRQLGQGLLSMTASSTIMRFAPNARGKANSFSNMGYSVAEAIIPTLIIASILTIGWRMSWVLVAVVMASLVPALIIVLAPSAEDKTTQLNSETGSNLTERQTHWTRSEVLRDPGFYFLTPALLTQSLLYTGFMFHQVHLVEEKGWPILVWGSLYAFFSVTSIVSMLITGALSDKFGAVRLAPFVTLPMAIGLLALSSSESIFVAAIFMFAMGISSGAQSALSAPFFAERYGSMHFGSIKSMATFIMVLMTAVSPIALGLMIDAGYSMDLLAIGSASFAFAIILVALSYSLTAKAN